MNETLKTIAKDALALMPATPARDTMIAAIAGGLHAPRRVAHVVTVVSEARDDEEWAEVSRFVELTYECGVLHFASYYNSASMIGASQNYDCRVDSGQPSSDEQEAKLKKWSDEWRDLLSRRPPGLNASVY